ncbi:MAG: hypothetical protein B6242_08015 [Anaerolineaceae bacterium 4572_78]|nr:MAG: hypothetical protein B6242_08015 [Anaerolineaceae bacterium 4572_78]
MSSFSLVITVLCATVGGSVIGGAAGYAVAVNYQPKQVIIRQPTSIPVASESNRGITADLESVQPDVQYCPTEDEVFIHAVEKVKPATVTVLNHTMFGMSSGSGVIIDSNGYIVTNHHVVDGAGELEVVMSHGGTVSAQLVGSTARFDLAVIKIDAKHVQATATLGDSSMLRQGQRVIAIGSALGSYRNTVTSGVISGHNRTLELSDGSYRTGLLQTDTPINNGNSGGPLVNLNGEVIGINTLVVRNSSSRSGATAEGLGFSIPSNTVKVVAQQLIETGDVKIPFLGIKYEDLNPQLSMENGLTVIEGALIIEVLRGTAAAKAGLQSDDVILYLNDNMVNDEQPLGQQLLQYEVDETVTLIISRGGQKLEISVTLGIRPNDM